MNFHDPGPLLNSAWMSKDKKIAKRSGAIDGRISAPFAFTAIVLETRKKTILDLSFNIFDSYVKALVFVETYDICQLGLILP